MGITVGWVICRVGGIFYRVGGEFYRVGGHYVWALRMGECPVFCQNTGLKGPPELTCTTTG